MSEFLSIADLEQAAQEMPTEVVEITSLGKSVKLRALSDGAVDALVKGLEGREDDSGKIRRAWIVACSVEPRLTNEHMDLLASLSSDVTLQMWAAVRRLNGLDADAEDVAQKNS